MDFSAEALAYAKRAFAKHDLSAEFVCQDVFAPGEPAHDLVFNAGVLEHYTFDQQVGFPARNGEPQPKVRAGAGAQSAMLLVLDMAVAAVPPGAMALRQGDADGRISRPRSRPPVCGFSATGTAAEGGPSSSSQASTAWTIGCATKSSRYIVRR